MNTLRIKKLFLLTLIVLLCCSLQYPATSVNAVVSTQRYVATTGYDDSDCASSSDPCLTLGYAISQSVGGDIINIAAGTYTPVNVTISKALTIQGAGMHSTILDGGGSGTVIYISAGPVSIFDLTIEDGLSTVQGGGLTSWNSNLTLTRIKVSGNNGRFGGGVEIFNGNLIVSDSLVKDNTSSDNGGGFYLGGTGTTTITGSTISGNSSINNGALFVQPAGGLSITNSTIIGNSCTSTATACRGGFSSDNVLVTILNTTITGNHSHNDAAVMVNGGTITFKNSIIVLNYRGAIIDDCRAPNGSFVSQGHNLRSDADCGTAATDILTTTPSLGPLQDNGGYTPTIALLAGSPAIDAGTNTGCPATDQRGEARPYNSTCDIGAFEYQPLPGTFGKSQPIDNAAGLGADIILAWTASSGVSQYHYCVDRSDNDNCDSLWFTTMTTASASLPGMSPGDYFWTVRAMNGGGYTYSDGGAWWSFSVVPPPGNFALTTPANFATNRPKNLTLSWQPSSNAYDYLYCLNLVGSPCTSWTSVGQVTSQAVGPLTAGKYQWLVKATNANGEVLANAGTWWIFTVPPKPGAFNKTSPLNNSLNKPTTLTLYWTVSKNAAKYEYCVKKSMSAPCSWKSTGLTRHVKLSGLLKNTKYFWQVRAKNANGTTLSNSGTWWNFTTK